MSKLEYLSEEMAEETLKEAADTFFGRRKRLDQELELFYRQADQLREKSGLAMEKARNLNYLFPDEDSTRLFWERMGLGDSVYKGLGRRWSEKIQPPGALTMKGRYRKCVLLLYDELRSMVDDYVHGRYIDHPEIKGKKVVTPSLSNLKAWAEKINKEIEDVNSCSKPDDVLAFARRMDTDESAKRESVGSGLEYRFDDELCFSPLDFGSLGMDELPVLPGDKKDYKNIASVLELVYREKKDQVRAILDEIYRK
jgi:hypothetical protein